METVQKLKYFLYGICIVSLSASLYGSMPPLTKLYLLQKRDPQVQNYVEENLKEIIREQETEMDLSYPSLPKDIRYLLPLKETDPSILGLYNNKTDTIYLQSGRLTTPGFNWGDFLVMITARDVEETKAVLDHELGHFYCDKLSENLGTGSWPSDHYADKTLDELISLKLVSEGIAEYFERTMNNGADNFTDSSWPKLMNKFYKNDRHLFYDGGYHLVKPILEKYGEEGIIYLMFKPPTAPELLELPAYQKKALKELDDPSIFLKLLNPD